MNRQSLMALVVVLALVVGVARKVGRYGERSETTAQTAATHIAEVMSAYGWSTAELPSGNSGSVYQQKTFLKPGCAKPVVVAILGGNAEGASFFRLQHGGDAAFIQGDVVDQPSGMRRQLIGMAHGIARMLGVASKAPSPVLAVSPAPSVSASQCSGPPVAAWRS